MRGRWSFSPRMFAIIVGGNPSRGAAARPPATPHLASFPLARARSTAGGLTHPAPTRGASPASSAVSPRTGAQIVVRRAGGAARRRCRGALLQISVREARGTPRKTSRSPASCQNSTHTAFERERASSFSGSTPRRPQTRCVRSAAPRAQPGGQVICRPPRRWMWR